MSVYLLLSFKKVLALVFYLLNSIVFTHSYLNTMYDIFEETYALS